MLRDQQRSLSALHANALFREFRGDGKGYSGAIQAFFNPSTASTSVAM
jgi:hypothetical protein